MSAPRCYRCGRDVFEAPLWRVAPLGEIGPWVCEACHPAPTTIDQETKRLVDIIHKGDAQ